MAGQVNQELLNQSSNLKHSVAFSNVGTRWSGSPSFDCEKRLAQDIAIVEIYYSTQYITKLSKSLTATFTDKLASIGKLSIKFN